MSVLLVALAAIGAYVGVTQAIANDPGPAIVPSQLPSAQLATTPLPADSLASLRQMIASPFPGPINITESSLTTARKLADTSAGPLIVVPATGGGVCIALSQVVSCGNANDGNIVVTSVFTVDSTGRFVGGGITQASAKSVSVDFKGATAEPATLVPGGFVFSGSPNATAAAFAGVDGQ